MSRFVVTPKVLFCHIEAHIGAGGYLDLITKLSGFLCFCLICFLTSHQQSFSYKGTGLPLLNQY